MKLQKTDFVETSVFYKSANDLDVMQYIMIKDEPEMFQEFLPWGEQPLKSSLADSFAELREICTEENYTIEVPPRHDRPNAFIDVLDELSF